MRKAVLWVLLVAPGLFITSCSETKCDDDVSCAGCRYPDIVDNGKNKVCQCVPNPEFTCPPTVINGSYDYDHCECICYTGWTGADCDQRDTAYFISFRHGIDTALLVPELRTNDVNADSTRFKGFFSSGLGVDSIEIIAQFKKENDTIPLCGWGCAYIELFFPNGDRAASLDGVLIVDSLAPNVYAAGTFNSNLYILGTGQVHYVREGKFSLYLFQEDD
jgi:hypothetical protein